MKGLEAKGEGVTDLLSLSALEAAREMRAGRLGCVEYTSALLANIERREPQVRAWVHLDRAYALAQARAVDEGIARGDASGMLCGVPVAVKDIIDVRGMPTEDGTVLHAGRIAQEDATLVSRLREAGAWPLGKTVTTELATFAPGPTRNPHDPSRTPGGSSSGSAAAVASNMVPLAIGTQTNGSVIRPAAYCGVVGYKPGYGKIGRGGVLEQSPSFDQVGVFARSVEDAAAMAQALWGYDARDAATRAAPVPGLAAWAAADPPREPRLGWARTPFWGRVDADARAAFDDWIGARADVFRAIELPAQLEASVDCHRTVVEADIAGSFEREYEQSEQGEQGRGQLSASLRGQIERGRLVSAVAYRKALAFRASVLAALAPLFESWDAIATPATLGTAPPFSEGTGDPLMCTAWTFCGLPAITLPLVRGTDGLPLGLQLVGAPGDDARLLRTARWLMLRG